MASVSLLEAFARYHAKPANRGRSAIATDGSLVMSCAYRHFHRPSQGVLRYEEKLSDGTRGVELLRAHLRDALADSRSVRLIVATDRPGEGDDAARGGTTFHAREDLVGSVVEFDGERFVIEFRKEPSAIAKPITRARR